MDWITLDVFAEGLRKNGFDVAEDNGFLTIERGDFAEAYPIRSDRYVPTKTYKRFVHGQHKVPITDFVPVIFKR